MSKTSVTLTGTGAPRPTPNRAGAGTLIQHNGESIQIDAGRATVLRLAEAGVQSSDLAALFLTHHHSDHIMDVPDLLISRWIMGNNTPLPVIAPDGALTEFGNHVLDVWGHDLRIREEHTGRPPLAPPHWKAFTATREPQHVWEGNTLNVRSVLVQHEPVVPAVAYRVDTHSGTSVVVSGDTRVCNEVLELSRGVDILVHEVVRPSLLNGGRSYIGQYHAEAVALGEMAAEAGVKHLMLTHLEPAPQTPEAETAFQDDIRRGGFTGEIQVGRDLSSQTIEVDDHAPVG